MEQKEIAKAYLEKLGYKIRPVDEGDASFMFEMKRIFLFEEGEPDGDQYLSLVIPYIDVIREGQEDIILRACNTVNQTLRIIKIIANPDTNSVVGVCGTYSSEKESVELFIKHALNAIACCSSMYEAAKKRLIRQEQLSESKIVEPGSDPSGQA